MADSAVPAAPGAAGEAAGGGVNRGERGNVNPSTSRLHHLDPRIRRSAFHARVRADALARQRAARGEGIEAARTAAREAAAAAAAQEQQGEPGDAIDVDASEASATTTTATDDQDRRSTSAPSPSPRPFWASQLMRHEWMVDAPDDLARNWLVLPRPEGVRCLLVSGRGRTVARARNGTVLHEFVSLLPGGGGSGGGNSGSGHGRRSSCEGSCTLDAVFQQDGSSSSLPGTFYALDVLSWGGRDLTGCASDFRAFWLTTKLSEQGCRPLLSSSPSSSQQKPSPAGEGVADVVALPAFEATPEGILTAFNGGVGGVGGGRKEPSSSSSPSPPFTRDGILFLHKESAYTSDEPNSLALVWKDSRCSRYVVETDARGNPLEKQLAHLRVVEVSLPSSTSSPSSNVRRRLAAATGDDPPVQLADLSNLRSSSPSSPASSSNSPFEPGSILRFAVGPSGFAFGGAAVGGEMESDGERSPSAFVVSADLELLSAMKAPSASGRGGCGTADTLSKLLFQHAARQGTLLSLEGLLEASSAPSSLSASAASAANGGGGGGGGDEQEMALG